MTISAPDITDKYEVLEKLGAGGMGEVYRVRHRLLNEDRVVKVMQTRIQHDESFKRRFLNEARSAIRLRHPNIASIIDLIVTEEGAAHIVMEFIDGRTLQEVLRATGPPDLGLTLEVAHQALRALAYLHEQGYLHRDFSPDNIMLCRDVEGHPLVKLIDLGLAKRLEEKTGTATGQFLGKIRYSSPEQFGYLGPSAQGKARGRTMTHRSDLYSFGVVFYEMLTGVYPIEGEDLSSVIAAHLFRPHIPWSVSDPAGRISQALRELVDECLVKDAEERLPSARHALSRLFEARDELGLPSAGFEREIERVLGLDADEDEDDLERSPARGGAHLGMNVKDEPTQPGFAGSDVTSPLVGSDPQAVPTEVLDPTRRQTSDPTVPGEASLELMLAKIEALLTQGLLEQADSELSLAERRFKTTGLFVSIRERLTRLRRNRQVQEGEQLLELAKAHLERRELAQAEEAARLAAAHDPLSSKAEALQERIQAQIGEQGSAHDLANEATAALLPDSGSTELRELEARQLAVAEAVDAIERRLAEGDLFAARERVVAALDELGEAEELTALRDDVEALVAREDEARRAKDRARREAERQQRARLEDLTRQVREHLDADDLTGAREVLSQLRAAGAGATQLAGLERELDHADRARSERARQELLRTAQGEVARLIDAGKLDEAARALATARREAGPDPVLQALETELKAAEYRLRTRDMLDRADRLLEAGQHTEALAQAKAVLELVPTDARAREIFEAVQVQRLEQERNEQRQRALTRDAAGIARLLDRGRLKKAARGLELAVAEYGRIGSLIGLEERLVRLERQKPPRPAWLPVALAAAALLTLVLAGFVFNRMLRAPEATGIVVIEAVPWGELIAIVDDDGTPQDLPPEPFTPLALALPPGSYTVTVRGARDADSREEAFEVRAGAIEYRQPIRFETVDSQTYLEAVGLDVTGAEAEP